MLESLLDWLESLSSNPWFYVIIFTIALLDSVVPVVPSETTVILGGIAAGQGELWIVLVVALGALGAFVGDNMAYWLGRRAGGWLQRTVLKREKQQKQLAWASDQLEKRGGLLLITARFIPGGRTAITLSSGITKQHYPTFMKFDAIAATLWASYAGILGFYFGDRFEDDHTRAFLYAFFTAISVTILIEIVRWVRERRSPESS